MKNPDSFADRQKNAQAAKARLVDRFKARPAPDDPDVVAKAAARQAILDARAERTAARELAEKARREQMEAEAAAREVALAAEMKAKEAAAEAEALERRHAELERAKRVIADEAERKAARDKRYADRKNRSRS